MMDMMEAFALANHGKDAVPQPPRAKAGFQRMIDPLRAPLPTKDGYLTLVLYTKQNWVDFFTEGGMSDAENHPRLQTPNDRNKYYAEIYTTMAEILKTRTTAEWSAWCKDHGVASSPIRTLDELLEDYPTVEHPKSGKYKRIPIWLRFSETPGTYRRDAPLPGEHNAEILREAGYSVDDIAAVAAAGGFAGTGKPR